MPTPQRYTERVIFLVSPEQLRWLRTEADRRGISMSLVLRELVDAARGKER